MGTGGDVRDFPPLRSWAHSFNLIVRVVAAYDPKYAPMLGHSFPVETDRSSYFYGGRLRLSAMSVEGWYALAERERAKLA